MIEYELEFTQEALDDIKKHKKKRQQSVAKKTRETSTGIETTSFY